MTETTIHIGLDSLPIYYVDIVRSMFEAHFSKTNIQVDQIKQIIHYCRSNVLNSNEICSVYLKLEVTEWSDRIMV